VNPDLLSPWPDERTPALAIVARGDQIRPISPVRYEVRSQSRPSRKYEILIRKDRWSCSCVYHRSTRRVCIHILAIRFREKLGDPHDGAAGVCGCPVCGSSQVIRHGRRHNLRQSAQRYLCKECGSRFTKHNGEHRLRHDSRTVALALDLYFRGLSLRKVADHLKQAYALSVAPGTIYGWIARFTPRAARWMDSWTARTGEQWHVDETVVMSNGTPRWVWNVEDASTRFLMATHVTKLRRLRDARVPIRRAKESTADRPVAVLTDGLPAYRKAIGRELAFRSGAEVVNPHVKVPSIRAKKSNNLVERLHGTEKERIKVMRGFHSRDGPKLFMDGFRVHYNLVRPHAALGTTPAVAAGLPDPGGFRWNEIVKETDRGVPRGQVELVFVTEGRSDLPRTTRPSERTGPDGEDPVGKLQPGCP
jgi:putative transposase